MANFFFSTRAGWSQGDDEKRLRGSAITKIDISLAPSPNIAAQPGNDHEVAEERSKKIEILQFASFCDLLQRPRRSS